MSTVEKNSEVFMALSPLLSLSPIDTMPTNPLTR